MTLIQLFAWLADSLLDRFDSIPERRRDAFRKIAARMRRRGRRVRVLIIGRNKKNRTAAVRFIASRLGLNLCRIDLSAVTSKWIGETEKNLRRLFATAEESGAILFFDEAQALFVKRSEVKDSHDRFAKKDITWLLERLQRYPGPVILSTDRRENLTSVVRRRFPFVVPAEERGEPVHKPQRKPARRKRNRPG